MWKRLLNNKLFVLIAIMVVFSLGILGQVDTRMHIGGSDWDLDNLIYINIDEYLVDKAGEPAIQQQAGLVQPQLGMGDKEEVSDTALETLAADEPEFVVPGETLALMLEEEIPPPVNGKEALTPPTAELPQVEEKKEEKPTIFIHKVHAGETLWDIAKAYGITVDAILSANSLKDPNRIAVGQELRILSVQGVLHKIATGESLWEIAERYEVSIDEIVKANSIQDPNKISPNTEVVIPGATRLRPRDVLVVNGQLQKAFDWPTRGRISSPFGPRWGRMHNGLDIAVVTGTPIKAAADGRVTFAGWNGGYGILVIIDHGNNVETRYAHNSRLNVKVGQKVSRGDVISYSGNTGVSTGPHLHFEIRYKGNPVNPQTYLK
ncbi:MAG: peptidoglycan DD-metalloendopeptidase family protein [Firmicutes bacterium]|jgi:murein DD-endopeptidase MepM/ murein hydrolase activator NlpD|nr:peptidoglycan DD-metalloendopeptidase family protein [Bacillota bacterium]NLO66410.1 peptidoglycan DD-metalloendopeptidase family protein [Bacillota bacterium]